MTEIHHNDAIRGQLAQRVVELEKKLAKHEEDLNDAAGSLFVDLPDPGTDAAKMLRVILRQREEQAAAQEMISRLKLEIANDDRSSLPTFVGQGVAAIADERQRQIEMEGWTPEHDDEHQDGELAAAAGCYALHTCLMSRDKAKGQVPSPWPWHDSWWKPGTARRNLERAGALIAAELERLSRQDGLGMTIEMESRVTMAARIAHEVNRAYCQALGDTSQPAWEDAPEWQRDSAIAGVEFHQVNPDAGPESSHNSWSAQKLNDGWRWGEVKDPEAKTHPCLVAFESLPVKQQAKDYLFRAVVHAVIGGAHE